MAWIINFYLSFGLDFSNIRTMWWYLNLYCLFSVLSETLTDLLISVLSHHRGKSLPHSILCIYLRHMFLLYFYGATLMLSLVKLNHMTCTVNITTHIRYVIILMKSAISSAFVLNFMIWDGKITKGNGVKKNKLAEIWAFIRFFW